MRDRTGTEKLLGASEGSTGTLRQRSILAGDGGPVSESFVVRELPVRGEVVVQLHFFGWLKLAERSTAMVEQIRPKLITLI